MKTRLIILSISLLILFTGIVLGIFLRQNRKTWSLLTKVFEKPYLKLYNSEQSKWSKDFQIIEIESSKDNSIQRSYFYKSISDKPRPLIVSLHSWSGDYLQYDGLAEICRQKKVNYIHPDFRGPNITANACCSELALADMDDAITYAIQNANVDITKIYVVGVSGGGYATLSLFMKSRHNIKKFSAWASITDLTAWYNESKVRESYYADDILNCTSSKIELDIESAKTRSPLYWDTPTKKLQNSKVFIYAGIYDGVQGSVPFTHSINFYNKLLRDLKVSDTLIYVTNNEKLSLLEKRIPLGEFGNIEGREIFLKKNFENLRLIVFEGGHEILLQFAFNELLAE